MVRSARIQLVLISALSAGAALGQGSRAGSQNNDFSVLVGPVIGSSLAVGGLNAPVNFSGVLSFQTNFAHTIHSYLFGDLWWETPSTFASRDSGEPGGDVKSASYSEYFFTPGVRLHVPAGSRVSFYGTAGVGYCSFVYSPGFPLSGLPSKALTNYHGVVDFGGGIDFRLTRLLSLRGDVRDFVTGRGLGGLNGRNHPIFGFGVAVHF
jgi:hypothetical protein